MKDKRSVKSPFTPPPALRVIGTILAIGAAGLVWLLYTEGRLPFKIIRTPVKEPSLSGPLYIFAHIDGAVTNPGLYRLRPPARVGDLVAAAGGASGRADLSGLNLAALLEDGQKITVPDKNFFRRAGIGKGPEATYIIPPLTVEKAE